jgi:uncharacterized protein YigE (DUF2233 family)
MKRSLTTFLLILATLPLLNGCDVSDTIITGTPAKKFTETTALSWQTIEPGLSYAQADLLTPFSNQPKNLILATIDPKKFNFSIYQNRNQKNAKTIKEIQEETDSLLSLNGSFFTEDFKPTGLLISEGRAIRKNSKANLLDGIFAIDNSGQAGLFDGKTELDAKNYPFAVQNGPVLIDRQGKIKISTDSGKLASRTAIGLDKNNNIVLIIIKQSLLNTDNTISLYEFAHLLKEKSPLKELQLTSVLNLDGGPSTGIMIGNQYFPEMERVQNIINVKKIAQWQ